MIRTADFDNDGDQDVVIAITNFIAWYENDGSGNFGEPNPIQINRSQSFNLEAVDIDNDSNVDLVVSYFDEDEIAWYRNLGDGSFSNRQIIASGLNGAFGVIQADIDGDGDADLVLGVTNGSGLYWVENLDGQGDFGPLITVDANLTQARRQRLGDMDGDGDMDIISNGISSWLSWFENVDGAGDFSIQHTIETQGFYENAFDIEDIDGDGDLDIVSEKNDELIWRENLDGLGNFSSIIVIDSLFEGGGDISIVDLDNDGFLDVLTVSTGESEIAWYKNVDGMGTFGIQQLIETELFFPRSVDTADLDNDGDLDVLVSTEHPEEIGSYWFNNETILGVQELSIAASISLFPNPTNATLQIKAKDITLSKITVRSLKGAIIFTTTKNLERIDVSSYSSGVYLVTLETANGETAVKKFVKK
jgi:hypothetical protein